jgi:hypothetical protein
VNGWAEPWPLLPKLERLRIADLPICSWMSLETHTFACVLVYRDHGPYGLMFFLSLAALLVEGWYGYKAFSSCSLWNLRLDNYEIISLSFLFLITLSSFHLVCYNSLLAFLRCIFIPVFRIQEE